MPSGSSRRVDKAARLRALQDAWRDGSFRCFYTGITLIDDGQRWRDPIPGRPRPPRSAAARPVPAPPAVPPVRRRPVPAAGPGASHPRRSPPPYAIPCADPPRWSLLPSPCASFAARAAMKIPWRARLIPERSSLALAPLLSHVTGKVPAAGTSFASQARHEQPGRQAVHEPGQPGPLNATTRLNLYPRPKTQRRTSKSQLGGYLSAERESQMPHSKRRRHSQLAAAHDVLRCGESAMLRARQRHGPLGHAGTFRSIHRRNRGTKTDRRPSGPASPVRVKTPSPSCH